MARVLHPSYFPTDISYPSCGRLMIPDSLIKSMETYWRVKKWQFYYKITISAGFTDEISRTLDLANVDFGENVLSETDLVCPKFRGWSGYGGGLEIAEYTISHQSNPFAGIFVNVNHDEAASFSGPDVDGDLEITITMGEFSKSLPATGPIFAGGTICSLTALEWWPYEDASGNALYDTATGQPP